MQVPDSSKVPSTQAQESVLDGLARDAPPLEPSSGTVDVRGVVAAGRPKREPPSVMRLRDKPDVGLFYPRALNPIFGDSEVGKSLLLYSLHAEHVNRGVHTAHLEFDGNAPEDIVWGIIDAGGDPEQVAKFLHVFELPSETPRVLGDDGQPVTPMLVTLDAWNPAIGALGLEINSSPVGVDRVVQTFITPFTSQGACAIILDHVGHQHQERASHSIRKRQVVSGVMYRMEVEGVAGRVGERWMSRLVVVKDRRGYSPPNGQTVAHIVFDGTAGDGTVRVDAWHLPPLGDAARVQAIESEELSGVIQRVLRDAYPSMLSVSQIQDECGGASRSTVLRELNRMREEGIIQGEQRGNAKTSPWYFGALPSTDG